MTPAAVTPAGRGTRSQPRQGSGHRTPVKRSTAPRAPRRISGPARPATAPVTAPSARPTAPSARPRVRRQPLARPPLARRCAARIRALPDHALLDRILRGRAWIPLLGVLLVGIVAMQVESLKLNASIGRTLEQGATLQTENEQLRTAVARAGDDQRIESMAAHMGMVMPAPAAIRFLANQPAADLSRALSSIHQPDATSFQSVLAAAGAAAGTAGSEAALAPSSDGQSATTTGD